MLIFFPIVAYTFDQILYFTILSILREKYTDLVKFFFLCLLFVLLYKYILYVYMYIDEKKIYKIYMLIVSGNKRAMGEMRRMHHDAIKR